MKKILIIFTLIACFFTLFFLLVKPIFFFRKNVTVHGDSMSPTLLNNSVLAINDAKNNQIERNQIVEYLSHYQGNDVMKIGRIIGLPGESIFIKKGSVYINDAQIIEPYLPSEEKTASFSTNATVLKQNEFYILGDNRKNSIDSRIYGPIHRDQIKGVFDKCISGCK